MKKSDVIFIIVFVIMLAIPSLAMPAFKGETTSEKRELAAFPKLMTDGKPNKDFTDELDDYINDHIAFRNLMISTRSTVMEKVFNESSVEKVILGSDGWLYFALDKNDYLNIATLTPRNAANVAKTYRMVQDYLNSNGVDFMFTVVPNKSSLYDNLPYYYVPLDEDGNIELLAAAFDAQGVNYCDLYRAFKDENEILYQKYDTHWNYKGAAYAYDKILTAAGFPHADYSELTYTEKEDWEGDLSEMLFGEKAEFDVQTYPDITFNFEYTSHEKEPDSITLKTYNENGNGNVVLYRDSYGDTMHVFFAETAENALFSRAIPYYIDYAKGYDLAVLEIVERNIINLASRAPMMAAPVCELNVAATPVDGGITFDTETAGGFVHVYGEIDEELLGDDYSVYILCDNGSGAHSYEAFPIYEAELLGEDEPKDNGYSAYIPGEEIFNNSLIVVSGESCYYYQVGW